MLIWDAYAGKLDALAFSPDGRSLALGGSNLACRLLDATTGERRWTVRTRCGFGLSLGFTPDGSVLCRGAGLSTRCPKDGTEVRRCGNWCRAFGSTRDGRTAYLADVKYRDVVRGYDVRTGRARGEAELEAGAIQRIAASPDGSRVAVVGCKRLHLLAADGLEEVAWAAQRSLSSGAFAVAFSPCGRTLVYTAGRTLFVWDAAAGREVHQFSIGAKHFLDAAFTPDGKRLITVGKEDAARVWATSTWECERSFSWKVGPLRAVAVSPDGHRAAVAGDSGRVVVWDLDE
jgi:WD40 repeat protein